MILTQENAKEYDGKLLDAKHGLFHYYPLRVVKHKTGYYVVDRHDTAMLIPDKKHGGFYFENVLDM